MTKDIRNTKGITLVSLVVTIILLVVLSTITINTVFGQGGLLDQAKESQEESLNKMSESDQELNSLIQEYNNAMKSTK